MLFALLFNDTHYTSYQSLHILFVPFVQFVLIPTIALVAWYSFAVQVAILAMAT